MVILARRTLRPLHCDLIGASLCRICVNIAEILLVNWWSQPSVHAMAGRGALAHAEAFKFFVSSDSSLCGNLLFFPFSLALLIHCHFYVGCGFSKLSNIFDSVISFF